MIVNCISSSHACHHYINNNNSNHFSVCDYAFQYRLNVMEKVFHSVKCLLYSLKGLSLCSVCSFSDIVIFILFCL